MPRQHGVQAAAAFRISANLPGAGQPNKASTSAPLAPATAKADETCASVPSYLNNDDLMEQVVFAATAIDLLTDMMLPEGTIGNPLV